MQFFSVDSLLDTYQESFISTNCEKHLPTFIRVQGKFLSKMRETIFDHIMCVHVIQQRKLDTLLSSGLGPCPCPFLSRALCERGLPCKEHHLLFLAGWMIQVVRRRIWSFYVPVQETEKPNPNPLLISSWQQATVQTNGYLTVPVKTQLLFELSFISFKMFILVGKDCICYWLTVWVQGFTVLA